MQRDAEDELIRQTLSLNCDICPNTSATFEERLVHYKDMHSDAHGYVKCCGKEFKKRTLLLDHAKLHINPDEYACPQCKKRFTSQIYLADHVVTHLPKEERPFQCEQCHKRYPTRHRLVYHQKTSHNEDLNVPCPLCDKSYRTDAFLKNHIKRVHEMADQHICEICARVFKTKGGFSPVNVFLELKGENKQFGKNDCCDCVLKCNVLTFSLQWASSSISWSTWRRHPKE